jgi:hypothetical protein
MMKFFTLFLLFFIPSFTIVGQNRINVEYKHCNDCTRAQKNDDANSFYQYGDATSYEPQHIVSDFGPRSLGKDFHGGIDFSSRSAEGDKGDLILAIEEGTVEKIFANNEYKYIVISGVHYNYGYGHIFRTQPINSSNPYLKSGNMVLKAIDGRPNIYAIIFLGYNEGDTPIALSVNAGLSVTWNNQQITTQNTVTLGQPISPIGDSFGSPSDTIESHLHLYRYPSIPSRNEDTFVNNPLENLTYPQADLTATLLHGDAMAGSDFRPLASNDIKGGELSKIRVRCQIFNTITGDNAHYNAIPNVDEVRLQLKHKEEDDERYQLMKGSTFDAKISLGGRQAAGNLYPNYIKDTPAYAGVTATNIVNGVKPFMYSSSYNNRPYDDYLFSDIVTGLHKNDPHEQALDKKTGLHIAPKLATWQQDALYQDGEYQLKAEILRINNEIVSSDPLDFTIDNFKPYLVDVRVALDGKQADNPIYSAKWHFNAALNESKGGLEKQVLQVNGATDNLSFSPFDRTLRIKATYSEAMKTQYILLKDQKANIVQPLRIEAVSATEYDYIFEFSDITRPINQDYNTYTIHCAGTDYGGNRVINMQKMVGFPDNVVMPYKKADNTWSVPALANENDESFSFNIQGSCSTKGGIQPEEVVVRSGCELVRFTYDIKNTGCIVAFNSNSLYDAGFWTFGDGGIFEPPIYAGKKAVVTHSYTKPGKYKVRLWYFHNPTNYHEEEITITSCAEDTPTLANHIDCQIVGPTLAKAGEVVTLTGIITGVGPFYESPWLYDPTKATPTSANPKGDGAHSFTINPFLMEGDRVFIDLKALSDTRATKTCTQEIVISGNPPKVKLLQYNTRLPKKPLLLAITQNVPSFSLVQYQFILKRNGSPAMTFDRDGIYEFIPDTDLIDGNYSAIVKVTYDNVTATSNEVLFTIGTPPAPTPPAPDLEILPTGNIEVTMGECTPLLQLKMNNLPPGQKVYDVTFEGQKIGEALMNEQNPPYVPYDYNYCIRAKQLASNGKIFDKGEILVPYSIARREGIVLSEKFCPTYEAVGCVDVVYEVCAKGSYSGKYVLNNAITNYWRPVPSFPYDLCAPVVDNQGDFYGTIPLFPLIIKEPCKINVKYKEMAISGFAVTEACQPSVRVLAQYGAADFSKGTIPSGAPCSGAQAYKQYVWKAYDAKNPSQELVGLLQNISSECVYIQPNHAYFQQFRRGDKVDFICKIIVTDWLDISKTFSTFVTMAVPLRIAIADTLPMCVGVDKSFEKNQLAISSTNVNLSIVGGGDYAQLDGNSDLHIQLPPDYMNGNINMTLSATDGNGCNATKNILIKPSELRITSLPTTQIGCNFLSLGSNTLGAVGVEGGSGKYTYSWSPQEFLSDPYIANPRVSGGRKDTPNHYTLTVIDTDGCSVESNPVTVTWLNEFYNFDVLGDKTVCFGEAVTLGANQVEIPGYTTEWTSNNPTFTGSKAPKLVIPAEANKIAGTWTYTIRAAHPQSGCYDTRDIKVKVLNDWVVKGYETASKFATNDKVALWSSTDNQIVPSTNTNYKSGATPPFIWALSGAATIDNTDANGLPTKGTFTPSPTSFLTLKVADANGCRRDFKTNIGIPSGETPTVTISMYQPTKIGGYVVCYGTKTVFKTVLDLNYHDATVSFPPILEADVTLHRKGYTYTSSVKENEGKMLLYLIHPGRGVYEGNYEYTFSSGSGLNFLEYIEVNVTGDLNNSSQLNTGNTFTAKYRFTSTVPNTYVQAPVTYCGNRTGSKSARTAAFTIGKKASICSYIIPSTEKEILAASAKGSITLYPGFDTELGAFFLAYPDPCVNVGSVALSAKVFLQGPYNQSTGLMNDQIRAGKLIPLKEPYSEMTGFEFVNGGGGETTTQAVFDVVGANAIVDWVFLQLRDKNTQAVSYTRAALVQRNGTVVDVDGISPVIFQNVPADSYYVTVRHRNHLGVMTGTPQAFTNIPDSGE